MAISSWIVLLTGWDISLEFHCDKKFSRCACPTSRETIRQDGCCFTICPSIRKRVDERISGPMEEWTSGSPVRWRSGRASPRSDTRTQTPQYVTIVHATDGSLIPAMPHPAMCNAAYNRPFYNFFNLVASIGQCGGRRFFPDPLPAKTISAPGAGAGSSLVKPSAST